MKSPLIQFFKNPYPFYEDTIQALKISCGIGVFISLFCYLFRPIGLDELDDISLLGFGLVSFTVCGFYMIILPLFLPKILTTRNWNIIKEIIWVILINVSLAFSNYFYLGYVFNAGYAFKWSIFLFVLTWTVAIAIIPAIAIIFYKQIFVYRKIVKEVEKIDAKLIAKGHMFLYNQATVLTIHSDNKNEALTIDANDLLFIASAGNYIEVFHLKGEHEIRKSLVRNNISRVEKDLKQFNAIIRCHRSYIINLNRVHRIKGNLQGYQLFLKNTEQHVPVSRSYTKVIQKVVMDK